MRTRAGRAALVLCIIAALAAPYRAAEGDAEKGRAAAKKAYDEGLKRANPEHYREAIEQFQKAHDLWKGAGDAAGQAQALERIGFMYQGFAKDGAKALDAFVRALDAARASKDEKLVASVLGDVARARAAAGDVPGGVNAYEEAIAIYQKLEDRSAEARTLSNIGLIYREAGDTAHADEYRAQAADMRARYNLPPLVVRVSGGVLASKALKKPQPPYPLEAREDGIQGAVVVEVTVSTDGVVESAKAVSGHPALQDAAIEAARGWTFSPTLLSGEPVRVIGTITFNFRRL